LFQLFKFFRYFNDFQPSLLINLIGIVRIRTRIILINGKVWLTGTLSLRRGSSQFFTASSFSTSIKAASSVLD